MKVNIKSDGSPMNTHVTDAQGNEILGLSKVIYEVDAGSGASCVMVEIAGANLNSLGLLGVKVDGKFHAVESITLKNGTILS